jgi:hypothetical protein
MMTTTSTMPTTPAPTALTPVVWPDVCSDDKCPNTTICVFRVPTVASRSPFTCFNGACNANCKNVLANGGACVLDEDGESNSNSTASTAVANSTATATSDALVCNSTAVAPVVNYPAIAPCSFNEAAKCELCTPTLGSCDRNTDLGDFCTPYEPCRTPDTYCLSAGVVVTGSLRCVPFECGVCGGELAACVVEVWNATDAPTFAGCVSTQVPVRCL